MKVRHFLLCTAVMGAGGYWFYNHGLSDEQRIQIQDRVATVKQTVQNAVDVVKPMVQEAMKQKNVDHSNQARTAAQWESLGY
ncbi:MAG: hypothetical protein ACI4B6_02810 [Atopobiaceae bacterium]